VPGKTKAIIIAGRLTPRVSATPRNNICTIASFAL
jgi:hypothetical protein